MRIATFNVQNLRLRKDDGQPRLDGARDADMPQDMGAAALALDGTDRKLTARVLRQVDADVVALQEVFDQETLDYFHDHLLMPTGLAPYPYRICLPGNDGRGQDVALLSRFPIGQVESHVSLTPRQVGIEVEEMPGLGIGPDRPIFRRDCVTAVVGRLTLFLCHFKAPYPDVEAAWTVRRLEAMAVRRLVEQRFPHPSTGFWLLIGDLNEPGEHAPGRSRAIAPLIGDFSVDLLARVPEQDRWTYYDGDTGAYSRPDALLASPALGQGWPDVRPTIVRAGLGREVPDQGGPRLPEVGIHRPHASDHAALAVDFPGL